MKKSLKEKFNEFRRRNKDMMSIPRPDESVFTYINCRFGDMKLEDVIEIIKRSNSIRLLSRDVFIYGWIAEGDISEDMLTLDDVEVQDIISFYDLDIDFENNKLRLKVRKEDISDPENYVGYILFEKYSAIKTFDRFMIVRRNN